MAAPAPAVLVTSLAGTSLAELRPVPQTLQELKLELEKCCGMPVALQKLVSADGQVLSSDAALPAEGCELICVKDETPLIKQKAKFVFGNGKVAGYKTVTKDKPPKDSKPKDEQMPKGCDSPVTTTSWEDVTSAAKEDFKSDLQQKPVKPDMTPVKETTLQTDKTKLLEAIKQTYGKSTAESITAILAQDEDEKPVPSQVHKAGRQLAKAQRNATKARDALHALDESWTAFETSINFKQNAEPHKRERSRSASHNRYASLQKNGDEEEDEDEKQG
ncbi:unnamed protein product [Effrenium voratum]|nr:unnamed protein product [Effrenium voratum]